MGSGLPSVACLRVAAAAFLWLDRLAWLAAQLGLRDTRPAAVRLKGSMLNALLWSYFRLPRDAGLCDVSKRSCLNLLRRGKSVAIAVGGGTEVG